MKFLELLLKRSKIIGFIIIILLVLHLVFGKPRWHYFPLYILSALFFILVLFNYFKVLSLSPNFSRWIIGVGIFLILITIFFILGFPAEEIPVPSGKFKIGTRVFDLEDKERDEIYTENENDKRKIKYQVWYPAEKIDGLEKAKWVTEGTLVTRSLAKSMFIPSFMLDHTADIYSNSYIDAAVSRDLNKYPVVIISHGWKGFRELHTDFAEELASNGFIAVSIDHTFGSQSVKFKDGSISYLNKNALPSFVKPKTFKNASNKLAKTYGNDVISVLNDLKILNNDHKDFKGKLDLDKTGLLGHSTGGGGDVYAGLKDKRVKAILGFDAWVEPLDINNLKEGLKIPSLFLRSEQWKDKPNNTSLKALIKSSDNSTLVQMDKTRHIDFTMSYMYSPLTKYVGFTGSLPGRLSSEIQREFVLKFFDLNLRDGIEDNIKADVLIDIIDKHEALKVVDIN